MDVGVGRPASLATRVEVVSVVHHVVQLHEVSILDVRRGERLLLEVIEPERPNKASRERETLYED